MAKLHVGRRVRTAWCPPHRILANRGHADPRLRAGTLEAGPYAPCDVFAGTDGGLYRLVRERAWLVRLDDGGAVVATEPYIPPETFSPRTANRWALSEATAGPSVQRGYSTRDRPQHRPGHGLYPAQSEPPS